MSKVILKEKKYVSRGGYKLEACIKEQGLEIKDKVCFDIGSSTGGFTDCLLQFGARKVYCVDVGKNLLHEKILKNPKVFLFEGINFRYFIELGLKEKITEKVDIWVVDVSFISLRKIIPVIRRMQDQDYHIIALVKPQFECDKRFLKKGIVVDEKESVSSVDSISAFAKTLGFNEEGRTVSRIKGRDGNTEYFLVLNI